MKRRALMSALALAPWLLPRAQAAATARGDAVAWPTVTLLDGSSWSATQARERAVVLVFWRIDCPYCERHMAHIAKLHAASLDKPLTVLGVARERDAEAVRRHMARRDWRFALTLDAAPMSAALSERRSVPLTVTVDRRGRLREVIPGEMFEDDVLGFLKLAA